MWQTGSMQNLSCSLCISLETSLFAQRKTGETYWRCDRCDLIFLEPQFRLKAGDEKARYLLHNNEEGDAGYLSFLRRLADPLAEQLPRGAQGLDFGAGPGPVLASYLESLGYPMSLYDPFFHSDQEVLKRKYDFVTCTEAAEHFFDPGKEFELIFSLLKPGGWLGVMTEFVFPDIQPDVFLTWYYARDPAHVCFYSEATMEWIARHFGCDLSIPRKNVALLRRG